MYANSIFQVARYPVGLYPGWLRLVVTWVVPGRVTIAVPAQTLIGKLPAGDSALFRFGLRRYAGTSS
ncbi:MAG: ABC-2 family transporter protein [Chloroflexota bacterium]|nr:ABC-2 family transporter protein [Chloroflexota bacterium]